MYCPNCGAQNSGDATYCANCGNELRRIETPGMDVPPPPQPEMQTSYGPQSPQPSVPNYLVQAILTTVFCCLPFGIVSIVYAAQVNGKVAAGDRAGALESSRNARMGAWIAFGAGLVVGVGYLLLVVVGAIAQSQTKRIVDNIHRDRLTASAVVALAAGGLSVIYLLDPSSSELYPPCPFLALTGFYCPGCGTLRALHQLTLGHAVTALDVNRLMVLLLPLVAYFLASHAMLAVTGRPLRKFFVRPALIWTLLGIILVYWLLRNLPGYPFTLLAPQARAQLDLRVRSVL